MKKNIFFILTFIPFILVSCYTKREATLLQEKNMPEYKKADYQPYKIKINDELNIRISAINQDISALFATDNVTAQNKETYRVHADSTIDIPFADRIKVAGLTLREAQTKVKESLHNFGCEIDVRLAFANNQFTVIGDAGKGNFTIDKERITIYQALAMAGDLKITGQYKNVHIIRETEQGPQIYTFDIRAKSIIDSEFYYIRPNDIIYVDRKKSSFVKLNSYSTVLGIVSSIMTLALTTWNLVVNFK